MAGGGKGSLTIEGTQKIVASLNTIGSQLPQTAKTVLDRVANEVVTQMKGNAPVRTGYLRDHISASSAGSTMVQIISAAGYSGYVNYGTRYMSSRPFFTKGVELAKQLLPQVIAEEIRKTVLK